MTAELEQVLSQIPMFSGLAAEDRQRLARVGRVRLYVRGQAIFHAGDPADCFHSLVRGRVKIVRTQPSGKEVILAILGAGDPVGAVAVYRGMPFPANAEALEDTVVVSIPRPDFYELLDRTPSLVRGLLLGMTQRLIELTARLSSLGSGRVEQRLARLFLRLAEDTGRPQQDGVLVPLRLSRQELADLTGTTIETCIRTMSRWNKDDIVRTVDGGFLVADLDRLRSLGAS